MKSYKGIIQLFFLPVFKESSCPPRPGSSSTTDDDLCMIGYMSARGDFVVVRIFKNYFCSIESFVAETSKFAYILFRFSLPDNNC